MSGTPPGLRGYAMPAEWTPHAATWIAWPHNAADWPGKFAAIPWAYGEFVRVLHRYDRVRILVGDAGLEAKARRVLTKTGVDLSRVDFVRQATDRVWTRDSGAIFVKNEKGRRIATHWKFNGWAKYPNHAKDDRVPTAMAKKAGVPEYRVQAGGRDVVMEGGAIDVDGAGLLMATEECLLDAVQARNPALGRDGTEKVLKETLGVSRVVWLGKGIVGDDTHGHIDDLARFFAPGKALLCREKDAKDENYPILEENRERLRGERIEVVDLPMPSPVVFDGQRVPASYANFYVATGAVIVPTFNDPRDRFALGVIADCFPGRDVIGVSCVDFIWGLGTLHCATQQEPEGL
ncbi:MAG TPA: agmatine deiminase family protein [Planctomycetota bacterium]|nr:agmatine deiminase family protein [Planctomycetota bacterium]